MASNPAGFGKFFDAVFVGEGEEWVERELPELARMKSGGAGRREILARLVSHPSVWCEGKQETVRRSIWRGFGPAVETPGPVSSLKIVQDEGSVEIMRGCPNGCRFCHAGLYYRPARIKEPAEIAREVEAQVLRAGYREVTLSSLSSADYVGLVPLVRELNSAYADLGVSFSLPSLKVESVGPDLFAELSQVRKSGLTFALETPGCRGQRSINKEAPLEKTIAVIQEARRRGWRNAKFYFMVGLPVEDGGDEAGAIIDVLEEISRETGMFLSVNVAAFIPKAHTPYQWARQLSEDEALERIMRIRHALPRNRFKVGYHAPFTSVIEGVICRGDGRAADLVHRAWKAGARLDAWEEHMNWDVWRTAISESGWDVSAESLRERRLDEPLPWDGIDLGVSKAFLRRELERSRRGEMTAPCDVTCNHNCGVCRGGVAVRNSPAPLAAELRRVNVDRSAWQRLLFRFTKTGGAAFLSHLDVMGVMERAMVRAGYHVRFTQGHNPKPRIEFASPVAVGIESDGEVAAVDLHDLDDPQSFCRRLSSALPAGFKVEQAARAPEPLAGERRRSLAGVFWGSRARVEVTPDAAQRVCSRLLESEVVESAEPDQGGVLLLHRHKPKKGCGLMAVISQALEAEALDAAGVVVTRLGQLARGIDGPVDYFSAFSDRP